MEADSAITRLIPTGAANALDSGVSSALSDHAPRRDAVRLLALDAHGRALNWISWQDAACLYARGAVAWTLGDPCMTVHGGMCRATGQQSRMDLHPIIAGRSHVRPSAIDPTPALTNTALFARDYQLCLYCGRRAGRQTLTRDHVEPLSRGGLDIWENVVTACFQCNSRKGARTPQEASMPLLAVTVPAELDRASDPQQSQHPRRPDGVPQHPSAETRSRRMTARHVSRALHSMRGTGYTSGIARLAPRRPVSPA